MAGSSDWMCIECGHVLGQVVGGELKPSGVPSKNAITRGPNLVITCGECGKVKVWYTADQVVRAVYQLIDAIASAMAGRMIFASRGEDKPRRNNRHYR